MTTATEIRRLLAPLASPSAFHLRISVGHDPRISPAHLLHAVVSAPDMPRGNYPTRSWPPTVEQLDGSLRLLTFSDDQILALLTAACTEDLAYEDQVGPWAPDGTSVGPWTPDIVRPILQQVAHLLGPQNRWWSNCVFPNWCFDTGDFYDGVERWPVTDHTFDRALIGIGDQATVTFLAFAED
ncbi:hypothetical protein [Actinomadura sp. 7K534]|uniref:hypothetical protein n=1 Tax=Actinomadura sp. 7K534 TaxID=2530366 RepID=UPI001047C00E|nr:hypothetical protein [Actinomadura sp. 7K534]TDB95485.1 hypothetical protein E1266_13195 [Actinomadura sp. 7K534]